MPHWWHDSAVQSSHDDCRKNFRVFRSCFETPIVRKLEIELTPEQQAQYELKPRVVESAKRDTKTIGDISEMHVILAMRKRGYDVSVPLGENHRYDLVVDDGEKLSRIQVKTGRVRGDVIKYNCSSSHAHRGGHSSSVFRPDRLSRGLLPGQREGVHPARDRIDGDERPSAAVCASEQHAQDDPLGRRLRAGVA